MSRASWSKLGGGRLRRDCPELEQGHGVQAPGEGARRVVGLRLRAEWEEARLLAGLPEVLLPVRSVKC